MTNQVNNSEADTRRLVVSIIDFLREQLAVRTDFLSEDRECLQIAMECLETAFDLEGNGHIQYRSNRPLMDIYKQVINPVSVKDKLRAESHKEEGNNYMNMRNFDRAETEYSNAIELDKWNAIYYANRAGARIEQRHYFEAIADCRQALSLNPDYAKAHSRMGQSYALLDRPREAARCFRRALELEPDNEKYQNNLRVAESQINNTPGIEEFITALLLGSLFGRAPRTAERSSSRMMPTSFMIISENHPPVPERQPQNAQRLQTVENSHVSGNHSGTHNGTYATPMTPYNSINNISFPQHFGIIDEGTEEQPPLNPTEPSVQNEPDAEFVIEIPLIHFDVNAESSHADSNLQNVENPCERFVNNFQNVDLDKNKNKTSQSEKSDENEDDNVLYTSFPKEFVNEDAETPQTIKYFPSGPEYIYHPSIKNNVNENKKCKNIFASEKSTKRGGKNDVNVTKNKNNEEGELSEKYPFDDEDDFD